ncbi:hypothetical protein OG21DRAFT_1064420 [Imleria badia]|nr:hypothetical protein OG21DRAFT_1064420 [Imleria badia]
MEQTVEASETKEFESHEVTETAAVTGTSNVFDTLGTSDADASAAQGDGGQTFDTWGFNSGGWGATATSSIKETKETVTSAAKKLSTFGFSSGSTPSLGFGMPNLKKPVTSSWGGMGNSFFGGGTKSEFELDPLSELTGGEEAEAPPVHVPPPSASEELAPETAAPTASEEPPSAVDQSATDNPTDAPGEEEQEDAWGPIQTTKKNKKGGGNNNNNNNTNTNTTTAGGKKKKKK